MNRYVMKNIEKIYFEKSDYILSEIAKITQEEWLAEEIYHECIYRFINNKSHRFGNDSLTAERIICKCISVLYSEYLQNECAVQRFSVCSDPLEIVIEEETMKEIAIEIDSLRTYSSVLKLYLYENLSVKEIASLLNLKPCTVSKHIVRGKIKLCRRLKISKLSEFLF